MAELADVLKQTPSVSEEEEDPYTGNVVHEYFSENAESVNSSNHSQSAGQLEDSDEFVLITTSENFGEVPADPKEFNFLTRTVSPKNADVSGKVDEGMKKAILEKRESDSDDYKFDAEALFGNKGNHPNKKFKLLIDEEQQRLRCNSDNTAPSRFKNILSGMKPHSRNVGGPQVFQHKQSEFKNCLSPSIMNNFVINECHFGEDHTKGRTSKFSPKHNEGFEDDAFNPFALGGSKDSETSNSQVGDSASTKGPSFKGLREFRASIDANDPTGNGRPNSSGLVKTHKQRKFTLSFDGTRPFQQGEDDDFLKFIDETSAIHKKSNFKQNQHMKDQEDDDASFEFQIEDDYFTDDLEGFSTKEDGGMVKMMSGNQETQPDTARHPSTQDSSESKIGKSNEQMFFFPQESTDSWVNDMSTSDDFTNFINYMEAIRKRLNSESAAVSSTSHSSNLKAGAKEHKSLSKSEDGSELKETLMNNYNIMMMCVENLKSGASKAI